MDTGGKVLLELTCQPYVGKRESYQCLSILSSNPSKFKAGAINMYHFIPQNSSILSEQKRSLKSVSFTHWQ